MKLSHFPLASRLALGGAVIISFSAGCFLRRPLPVIPTTVKKMCGEVHLTADSLQTGADGDSVTTYLINRGWRFSLALQSEDAVEELGWMVDETHNHPWVELAWGYGENVVPEEEFRTSEALKGNKGEPLFLARGLVAAPRHEVEVAEVTSLRFPRTRLSQLLSGLKSGIAPSDTGASTVVADNNPKIGTIYKGAADERAGRSSVRWIAQRLYEAGCPVDPTSGRTTRLLNAVGNFPPNTRHD